MCCCPVVEVGEEDVLVAVVVASESVLGYTGQLERVLMAGIPPVLANSTAERQDGRDDLVRVGRSLLFSFLFTFSFTCPC